MMNQDAEDEDNEDEDEDDDDGDDGDDPETVCLLESFGNQIINLRP